MFCGRRQRVLHVHHKRFEHAVVAGERFARERVRQRNLPDRQFEIRVVDVPLRREMKFGNRVDAARVLARCW